MLDGRRTEGGDEEDLEEHFAPPRSLYSPFAEEHSYRGQMPQRGMREVF